MGALLSDDNGTNCSFVGLDYRTCAFAVPELEASPRKRFEVRVDGTGTLTRGVSCTSQRSSPREPLVPWKGSGGGCGSKPGRIKLTMDKGIQRRLETHSKISPDECEKLLHKFAMRSVQQPASEGEKKKSKTDRFNNLTSLNNDDLFDFQFSDRLKFSLRKGSCKFDL